MKKIEHFKLVKSLSGPEKGSLNFTVKNNPTIPVPELRGRRERRMKKPKADKTAVRLDTYCGGLSERDLEKVKIRRGQRVGSGSWCININALGGPGTAAKTDQG